MFHQIINDPAIQMERWEWLAARQAGWSLEEWRAQQARTQSKEGQPGGPKPDEETKLAV
jgi:hypothetical protein